MKYTDEQRVSKILLYAEKLMQYAKDNKIDRNMLEENYAVQWAVTTPLYNIGENAYNLSDDFKKQFPEIQWSLISGLRHRLVHDYDSTNWEIIYDVIFKELPVLIKQLKDIQNGKS